MTALKFRDLTLGYDRHPAVHHLDGAGAVGSLTAVVGPNGASKSTLFKGVVGTLKPLAGGIERNGFAARDIDFVRANFPHTLLLAREPVAWGVTREVLTAENLDKARRMCEAFDEAAEACAGEAA